MWISLVLHVSRLYLARGTSHAITAFSERAIVDLRQQVWNGLCPLWVALCQ